MRMLPAVDALYSGAKGAFYPGLRYGLRWTIEGEEHIAPSGPVILASNHISYLDPLTLAYVADKRKRRLRFLAKAELFDKRGFGMLLQAAHQIPVQRGTSDAASSLAAAVDALGRGECVAVFPEGTISLDLEPMAGKSGTARLAKAAGVAVTPVGLWGSHRIMFKGRKPHWQWGVAQIAVVGKPVTVEPDEHVKRSDRSHHGRDRRVRRPRPRDLPAATRAGRRCVVGTRTGDGRGAGPDPVERAPAAQGRRAANDVEASPVVGAGSWGTAVAALVAANAPTTLWARRPDLAGEIDANHENPDYLPGVPLPDSMRATASIATRVAAPTSSCSVCRRTASGRCSARRVPTSRHMCPSSACRRASSRARCAA